MKDSYDGRISVGERQHDYILIPTIAVLDMDKQFYMLPRWKYRIAFGFWNWRISFALGKARWKKDGKNECKKMR